MPSKLAENPLLGKPLGYPFLREKRIKEKNMYLIYEELKLVLLVAVAERRTKARHH